LASPRRQVDPARSDAANKAWETRRRLNPAKFGSGRDSNTAETKPSRKVEGTPTETKEVKWHLTSASELNLAVKYSKAQRLTEFDDFRPWTEKFRPISLNDCLGSVVNILKAFVRTGSIPLALIFHGEYGCGKTTCAKAFVRDFYVFRGLFHRDATFLDVSRATKVSREFDGIFPPALFVDATLVRDQQQSAVEVIRTRIQNFMMYSVGKWIKFIIIDEADRLGFEGQSMLSSLIEKYPNTRTIYTTNYLDDIMDRIVSRAAGGVLEFKKPESKQIVPYLRGISKIQKIRPTDNKLLEIAKRAPSIRDAVGLLQQECAILQVTRQDRRKR